MGRCAPGEPVANWNGAVTNWNVGPECQKRSRFHVAPVCPGDRSRIIAAEPDEDLQAAPGSTARPGQFPLTGRDARLMKAALRATEAVERPAPRFPD